MRKQPTCVYMCGADSVGKSELVKYVATRYGIRWSFGVGLPVVAIGIWAAKALAVRPGGQPPR